MPFKSCFIAVADFILLFRGNLLFGGGGPLRQDLGNILLAGTHSLIQGRISYLFRDLSGSRTFKEYLRKHSGFNLLLPYICILLYV